MTDSKCGKCGNLSFKVVLTQPSDPLRGLAVVQCAVCGVPIGVVECLDLASRLEEQKTLLRGLDTRLANLEDTMNRVLNQLRYD